MVGGLPGPGMAVGSGGRPSKEGELRFWGGCRKVEVLGRRRALLAKISG